jgi:hypothetical protein
MAGVPGWICQQYCSVAATMDQLLDCTGCAANTDNPWGCFNCINLVGDSDEARTACMGCVRSGVDGYACGQCAMLKKDTSRARCYACVAKSKMANESDNAYCF